MSNKVEEVVESTSITFLNIWKIPGFTFYAISFSCLKTAFYGLLLWLPYYLDNHNES